MMMTDELFLQRWPTGWPQIVSHYQMIKKSY